MVVKIILFIGRGGGGGRRRRGKWRCCQRWVVIGALLGEQYY